VIRANSSNSENNCKKLLMVMTQRRMGATSVD
jgi:hypothetical protein